MFSALLFLACFGIEPVRQPMCRSTIQAAGLQSGIGPYLDDRGRALQLKVEAGLNELDTRIAPMLAGAYLLGIKKEVEGSVFVRPFHARLEGNAGYDRVMMRLRWVF